MNENFIIIELPEFDFKNPYPSAVAIEPLLDNVRQFPDTKGVNNNKYALGSQLAAELGELVVQKINDFFCV